jgi:hypothetical protein
MTTKPIINNYSILFFFSDPKADIKETWSINMVFNTHDLFHLLTYKTRYCTWPLTKSKPSSHAPYVVAMGGLLASNTHVNYAAMA